MKLEQVLFPHIGVCRLVMRAEASELAAAIQAVQHENATLAGDDLMNAAVNRALMDGISPVYQQAVQENDLIPIKDPSFDLIHFQPDEGFVAAAEFYIVPPLTLGQYTGFVQPIEAKPVREFEILMDINQHQSEAYDAADEAGKREMGLEAAARLYARNCRLAEEPAKRRLLLQLGDHVTGPLNESLLNVIFLEELRNFFLRLEANKLSFDMYLQATHQTHEDWEAELHRTTERKLRSEMGLLLVAKAEGLAPTAEQVTQELQNWNVAKYQKPTFLANDVRRIRQHLTKDLAREFILAHSTLIPPAAEPVIQKAEP